MTTARTARRRFEKSDTGVPTVVMKHSVNRSEGQEMSQVGTRTSPWHHAATLVVGLLLVPAAIWLGAVPASAAPVSETHGDITYEADDSNRPAGARVTAYGGAGGAVDIPDSIDIGGIEYDVVTIEQEVFQAADITAVTLGSNITTIRWRAFSDNQIAAVDLPAGLVTLEGYSFADNQLTSVALPPGFDFPTNASAGPFRGNRIESVTLLDSMTFVPLQAFYVNEITHVVIPASITEIRQEAFGFNPLATVDFLGDTPDFVGTGAWIPGADITYLCRYDVASGGGFTSPSWSDGQEVHVSSAKPVTVTFENAHGPDATSVVDCNAAILEPQDPVADGYEFVGWTINGDGFSFDDLVARVDVTIVAEWVPADSTPGSGEGAGDGATDPTPEEPASDAGQLPGVGTGVGSAVLVLSALLLLGGSTALIAARHRTRVS